MWYSEISFFGDEKTPKIRWSWTIFNLKPNWENECIFSLMLSSKSIKNTKNNNNNNRYRGVMLDTSLIYLDFIFRFLVLHLKLCLNADVVACNVYSLFIMRIAISWGMLMSFKRNLFFLSRLFIYLFIFRNDN